MTVGQAAELLRVTPDRVRQLIRAGQLRAERFGRSWIVDEAEAHRIAAVARPTGRPLSAGRAWRRIRRMETGTSWPGTEGLGRVAAALRARSGQVRFHVHGAAFARMTGDRRLVAGGAAAAAQHGAPLIVVPPLDFYVRSSDLGAVVVDYVPVEGPSNLTLRPVEDASWPFADDERLVGPVTAVLDLVDAADRGVEQARVIWPDGR